MLEDMIYLQAIANEHMMRLSWQSRCDPLGMFLISPRAL